jgi:hypothetical protein
MRGPFAEPTPHPARPSADGLVKAPVAVHPLPSGEGWVNAYGALPPVYSLLAPAGLRHRRVAGFPGRHSVASPLPGGLREFNAFR